MRSDKVIYNINHLNNPNANYQIMSLPQRLTLAKGEINNICIEPAEQLASLRVKESHVEKTEILLEANSEYYPTECFGDTMELIAVFEAKDVPIIELKMLMSEDNEEYTCVRIFRNRGYRGEQLTSAGYRKLLETVVQLDTLRSTTTGNVRVPDMQSFYLEADEKLNVRIFLDRSVIEVFVNNKVMLAARVSPTSGNNKRLSIVSRGKDIMLHRLESYRLCL